MRWDILSKIKIVLISKSPFLDIKNRILDDKNNLIFYIKCRIFNIEKVFILRNENDLLNWIWKIDCFDTKENGVISQRRKRQYYKFLLGSSQCSSTPYFLK